MNLIPCPGCEELFPDIEGPTHRYMESSPGCWAAYGKVLAREYSNPEYFEVHRLTVDAYAVQHPGKQSKQSLNSVGYHLIRLCLLVEKDLKMEKANAAMLQITKEKEKFFWLTPPSSLGKITVKNVLAAVNVEEYKKVVWAWAKSVWNAWEEHHPMIYNWLPELK